MGRNRASVPFVKKNLKTVCGTLGCMWRTRDVEKEREKVSTGWERGMDGRWLLLLIAELPRGFAKEQSWMSD